jgi:predicted PurR-regulated permease PerM
VNILDEHPETRWGLNFIAVMGVIVALALGKPLIMPLVVALMLAAVFWPLVELLRVRWWLPRSVAAIVVMSGLIFAMTLGIIWIVAAAQSTWQDLLSESGRQAYYDKLHTRVAEDLSPDLAEKIFPKEKMNESFIFGWIRNQFSMEGSLIPSLVFSTSEISMIALLVLFLALFLWIDGEMLGNRIGEIFGPRTGPYFAATLRALAEMAKQVRNYLVWRTVLNIFITLIMGLTYSYMGLKQPWTWAIFAGVMSYIPYIGPVLGGLPAVFDGFINRDFVIVLYIISVYCVLLVVEGYVLFPLVVGRQMEMNATTVILACLFWQLVWGGIGLFLAMPLTAGIKAICTAVPMLRPWANLMGQHEIVVSAETAPEVWSDSATGVSSNGQPTAHERSSLLHG